eukprot:m.28688 g.28688  ORF g.28688 m.28688 type:complete len:262 (-) comp6077_c0_seq4:244-1029(-)
MSSSKLRASRGTSLDEAKRVLKLTEQLFGLENVCLSFNGGKDSTVLLDMVMAEFPDGYHKITYVYFQQQDEFDEVLDFIRECDSKYSLNLKYLSASFKDALSKLLEEHPNFKAILLGTRVGDPFTTYLSLFTPCDEGWPMLMRVFPILNWKYAEVWNYLQQKEYCTLYDQGYTSLGSKVDTVPNPKLREEGGHYLPAWLLANGKWERLGRKKFGANRTAKELRTAFRDANMNLKYFLGGVGAAMAVYTLTIVARSLKFAFK